MSADRPTADTLEEVNLTVQRTDRDDFSSNAPQNDIESFADALFGRVAPEDLTR